MPFNHRAAGAAAFAYAITAASGLAMPAQALAAAQDYRFELAAAPVKAGKATLIKIRLLHLPDGRPVSGAVILQTKFDMVAEGMASMTAPAKVSAPREPGIYQIATEPPMGGNWALSLSAKVQGETETLRGTVAVAVPN